MKVKKGSKSFHVIDERAGERLQRDGTVIDAKGRVIAKLGESVDVQRAEAWRHAGLLATGPKRRKKAAKGAAKKAARR